MKVVSEELGHSALAITADTYTSVLPAVAHAAAEAVAGIVPRAQRRPRPPDRGRAQSSSHAPAAASVAAALTVGWQSGPEHDSGRSPETVNALVRGGAPSGTRTPNPLIKRTKSPVRPREGLDQW
jgi:hypothetical protein